MVSSEKGLMSLLLTLLFFNGAQSFSNKRTERNRKQSRTETEHQILGKYTSILDRNAAIAYKRFTDVNTQYAPNNDINLTLYLEYLRLHKIDDKQQVMTSSINLTMVYKDKRLAWENETEDGNNTVDFIVAEEENIWKPNLYLTNGINTLRRQLSRHTTARVRKDGLVMLTYFLVVDTSCDLRIRLFPYDEQKCGISWDVVTFMNDNLLIRRAQGKLKEGVDIHNEWEIQGMDFDFLLTKSGKSLWRAEFIIKLKRRSMYYNYFILLPGICITAVSFLQFLLPPLSGEKSTFTVTCLLSMVVFLIVLLQTQSPDETHLPLLGRYIAFMTLNISMLTASSVLVTAIYYHGESNLEENKVSNEGRKRKEEPSKTFCLHFFSSVLNRYTKDTQKNHDTNKMKHVNGGISKDTCISEDSGTVQVSDKTAGLKNEWAPMARRIDMCSFLVNMIFFLSYTTYFLAHEKAMSV